MTALRREFEEERVIWGAEKDVLNQQIESLMAELNESKIASRTNGTGNEASEGLGMENRRLKEEIEVMKQVRSNG